MCTQGLQAESLSLGSSHTADHGQPRAPDFLHSLNTIGGRKTAMSQGNPAELCCLLLLPVVHL